MRRKSKIAISAVTAALCVTPLAAITLFSAPANAADKSSDCGNQRVAGLSYILDALQTGSAVGPSIAWGVAQVLIGQPLPGELGVAQAQLLDAVGGGVEKLSELSSGDVAQLKADVAVLAAANGLTNGLLGSTADLLTGAATQLSGTIQPFDLTLNELAGMVRSAQEPSAGC